MKRLFLISTLLLLVSAFAFSQTQVLSGTWGASSDTKSYTLNQNSGDRTITIQVNFLKPFENKPDVVCGISSIDVDKATLQLNMQLNQSRYQEMVLLLK